MSSTNQTTNYGLSQYVGSDKPTYLGDYNSDMLKIDTQMKTNADNISANTSAVSTANTNATQALTNASTAQTTADTAQSTANTANNTATSALSKANTNESAIIDINKKFDYTLTESVIGTWIDGKPLYRKIKTVSNVAINSTYTTTMGLSDVETVTGYKVMYLRSGSTVPTYNESTVIYDGGGYLYFYTDVPSGDIRFNCFGTDTFSAGTNKTWVFIAEYTKTTDVAPTVE